MTGVFVWARKGIALLLALLLIGFLWPVAARTGDTAAFGADAENEAVLEPLITAMSFDATALSAQTYRQENSLDRLFACEEADRSACLAPDAAKPDVWDAVTAALPEGFQPVDIASITWERYLAGCPHISAGNGDLIAVTQDEQDPDTWIFTVLADVAEEARVTVDVQITRGLFGCVCVDDAGQEQSVDVALDLDACTVSYDIALSNAQDHDRRVIMDLPMAFSNAVYMTPSVLCTTPLAATGSYDVQAIASDPACIDVQAGHEDGRIRVACTPRAMFPSDQHMRLIVRCGSDVVADRDIAVPAPAKKPVTLTIPDMPFRAEADQVTAVAQALDQAAADAGFAEADLAVAPTVISDDSLRLAYPLTVDGFDATASFELCPALAERYELVSSDMPFHVHALEQEETPAGFALLNGASKDTWVNTDVVARYEGHQLAKSLDGTFADEQTMNSAEGSYVDQSLYAKDSHGIITKVTGIAYNVDKTAPCLDAFSVNGEHVAAGDGWFFPAGAHAVVTVSDRVAVMASSAHDAHPAASGLQRDGASVTYEDSRSGNIVVHEDIKLSPERDAGTFSFAIEGDQDVPIRSCAVHVQDAAGNVLDADLAEAASIPDDVMRLVADAAPPELSVAYDGVEGQGDGFFNAPRTGTFTVTEAHFRSLQTYDPDQTIVSIVEDGQAHVFRAAQFESVGGDAWQVSFDFRNDAEYTVQAQVVDLAGKSSALHFDRFTVDTTSPALSVVFDDGDAAPGRFFNASRTATISITERNFSPERVDVALTSTASSGMELTPASQSAWTESAGVHMCTVSFPGQGIYGMSITGTDRAANPLPGYLCPEFTVDTVAPEVTISVGGDPDAAQQAYRGRCDIAILMTDANVDPLSSASVEAVGLGAAGSPYALTSTASETQLAWTCSDLPVIPESDSVYRLAVTARDRAGNEEVRTITWSVNRFGSTYMLHDDVRDMVSKGYLRSADMRDVCITEMNPSGVDERSVAISMTHGMRTRTLTRGQDYSLTPQTGALWPTYEYRIRKECFASDGLFQVMLHSTDVAGNASLSTMDGKAADRSNTAEVIFSVDDTPPLVTFNGISERTISGQSHTVGFSVEDNAEVARAVVSVNGAATRTLDADALADPASCKVSLSAGDADQVVSVEAFDKAGNRTVQTSPSLFINANPIARHLHDSRVIAAGTALIAVAVLGAALRFKRKPQHGSRQRALFTDRKERR